VSASNGGKGTFLGFGTIHHVSGPDRTAWLAVHPGFNNITRILGDLRRKTYSLGSRQAVRCSNYPNQTAWVDTARIGSGEFQGSLGDVGQTFGSPRCQQSVYQTQESPVIIYPRDLVVIVLVAGVVPACLAERDTMSLRLSIPKSVTDFLMGSLVANVEPHARYLVSFEETTTSCSDGL